MSLDTASNSTSQDFCKRLYGVPRIVIQEVLNDTLCLEHLDRATTFLDRQYANNTLMYIAELWKHPVNLLTNDEDGRETTLTARLNT